MDSREVLLFLSIKYNGDYSKIYKALCNRDYPSIEDVSSVESNISSEYITILDDAYPNELKQLVNPPIVLYYYGDLSLLKKYDSTIAVIGSREPSDYGKQMTKNLVSGLSFGYIIISGLSKGIGTIALNECLKNNGRPIVVMGSGIDKCYPSENFNLYEEVKRKGLLISEYPNDLSPQAEYFPMRNRIIASLSKGILITDAHKKSGPLTTALFGLSSSKEVMCVPHSADSDSACNQLIKGGASLVEDVEDVVIAMSDNK